MLKVQLDDDDLFGNEAAEDEREEIFQSYAYERPELARFCDSRRRLQLVRAYKGEGKSALMRLSKAAVEKTGSERLIALDTSGPALTPTLDHNDFAAWVRAWMTSIVTLIASEVGSRINMAWSDDATALVELAENNGFRQKNIVSSILDRIKTTHIPISHERQPPADATRTLARWSEKAPDVWVFVDDIDRNFDGSSRDALRTAAFFEACRGVLRHIPSVRLRVAVRPNTWTTLKRQFEGMSHLEQYACDLRWSESDMRELLSRRIHGYLQRSGQTSNEYRPHNDELLSLVFETPVQWAGHSRPIYVPLDTLSLHRPRWLVELCRVSAQHAFNRKSQRITLHQDVFKQLGTFGARRLDDTVAEFKPQCPQIAELLDGFRSQSEQYMTADLLKLIENRITNHVPVQLPGGPKRPEHRDVAAFLFQIGFIYARKDFDDGSYEHIGFTQQPTLLASRADMDSGCSWEIPPIFRQALNLRTNEGFERPINSKKCEAASQPEGTPAEKKKRRIVRSRGGA